MERTKPTGLLVSFCLRHALKILVFVNLLFPAVYLPLLFFYAWPLELDTDFTQYIKSDVAASIEHERVNEIQRDTNTGISFSELQRRRQLNTNSQCSCPICYQSERSCEHEDWELDIVFKVEDDGNIFEKSILETIRKLERELESLPGYDEFCRLVDNTNKCELRYSPINFLFPSKGYDDEKMVATTITDGEGELYNDIGVILDQMKSLGHFWFLPRSLVQPQATKANVLRIKYRFAGPLDGFVSVFDRPEEQNLLFEEFARNQLYPFLEENHRRGDLRVLWLNSYLTAYEIQETLYHDVLVAGLALFGVLLVMWFHTGSFLLSFIVFVTILSSFPITYVLYVVLFSYETFSILNTLALFIIAGIGADDFFIFFDIWKSFDREVDTPIAVEDRLVLTWKKASFTTLVTTVTTSVAFLANLASIIAPIRDFGLYVGMNVAIVYCCLMISLPPAFILYDRRRLSHMKTGKITMLCSCKENDDEQQPSSDVIDSDIEKKKSESASGYGSDLSLNDATFSTQQEQLSTVKPVSSTISESLSYQESIKNCDVRKVEGKHKMCRKGYGNCSEYITHIRLPEKLWRFKICLVLFLGGTAGCLFGFATTKMEPNDKIPTFFSSEQNLGMIQALLADEFSDMSSDEGIIDNGIVIIPDCVVGSTEPCIPTPFPTPLPIPYTFQTTAPTSTFQPSFAPTTKSPTPSTNAPSTQSPTQYSGCPCNGNGICAQGATPDNPVCDCRYGWTVASNCSEVDESLTQIPDSQASKIYISILSPEDWVEAQVRMIRICDAFKNISSIDRTRLSFRYVIACPLEMFRQENGPNFPVPNENDLAVELGYFYLENTEYSKHLRFDKSKPELRMLMLSMEIQTGIDKRMGSAAAHDYYTAWEEFVDELDTMVIQTSPLWARAETELALISSTITSWIISSSCAFLSILIFTKLNLFISLASILSISLIVCTLIGFMIVVMERKFGVIEALSVIVFVGYSADFCLHLAHSFLTSPSHLRILHRFRFALEQTTPAIFYASLTTALAGIVLLFCKIVVFNYFGIIIALNTVLSFIYAVFFFIPLLMILGNLATYDIGIVRKGTCLISN